MVTAHTWTMLNSVKPGRLAYRLLEILQHWEFSCKFAHDGHFTQTELNVQFKFLVLQACEVWWVVNCTRFYVTDVLVSLWNNANNKFCEVDKPRKMIYADYSFRFSWGYECDCNVSFSIKLSFKCVCLCVSWAAGGCTRGPCSTRHWSMRVCVSWPIMISPTVLVFYEFSCACSARFTLFLFALWDTVRCSFCSSPLSVLFFVSINDEVFHLDGPRLSFMFYCLSQS